ncbi:MAG: hypothetical protein IJY76_06110, partial [Anaerotignum sp.]|nr:hypothetical protein [Anaerotignum sp.]
MAEKIMLIDGNSIVNRAFYGVPLLTNKEGKYTFGFTATPYYQGKFVDEECFDVSCYGYDVYEAIN